MSSAPQRMVSLGGGAGAAALSAVAVSHLFLLPLPGFLLSSVVLVGAALTAGAALTRIAPRLVRAAAVGGLLIFIRVLFGGLPVPAVDAERAPLIEDREVSAEVVALLAPLQGAQRIVVSSNGLRVAVDAPPNPALKVGDLIRLTLKARSTSPQARERQRVRGIDAAASTRAVVITGGGSPLEALRARIGDDLERVIPAPAGGLAAAIFVGLRERVDERLADAFTTTGLGHVVALSGWNVAIAMAVADRLLRRQPGPRRRPLLFLIALLYGLFAGASPSVIRASFMAAAALAGASGGRPGSGAVALSHAALALLIIDPAIAYDAGFRLSALATAGLLAKSKEWSVRALNAGSRLPLQLRAPWLAIAEEVAVALAAQAATLGLVIASFGRVAIWSIPLTLTISPLVAPATGAAVIAIAAGEIARLTPALNAIAVIAAAPAAALFGAAAWIATAGSTLPLGGVTVAREATAFVGLTLGIGGVALLLRKDHFKLPEPAEGDATSSNAQSQRRRALAGAVLIACTALLQGGRAAPAGELRIAVLDVGQGDAILVESRNVRMLIDGGPDPSRLSVELDRLIPAWDRRIDLVIATHPHEDHLAGLPRLADRYRVRSVAGAEQRGPGPAVASWEALMKSRGLPYATLTAGDRFDIGAAHVAVLWPDRTSLLSTPSNGGRSLNDRSIVLRLDITGFSALLTGDVESDVDGRIAARVTSPVDLLKSPHHGSATSASRVLLNAARPRISIVSAGRGNPYGHPAATTLQRLAELGGAVERTDTNGTVTISVSLNGSGAIRASDSGGAIEIPARNAIRVAGSTPQHANATPDALLPTPAAFVVSSAANSPLACAIAPATIPPWEPSRSSSPGVTTSSSLRRRSTRSRRSSPLPMRGAAARRTAYGSAPRGVVPQIQRE